MIGFGQTMPDPSSFYTLNGLNNISKEKESTNKLSLFSRMFLKELKTQAEGKKISKELRKSYFIYDVKNIAFVGALIKVNDDIEESLLLNLGVKIGARAGNIWSVQIPIYELESLLNIDEILYIEIDYPVQKKLDSARQKTFVNWVHNGQGGLNQSYYGKDVVVGIIDGGYDYTHPQFYDSLLTSSRIKMIWEQSTSGSNTPSPPGYSYGYYETDIDSILSWGYDRDNASHGTHVAGIAAGGGFGNSSQYKGVASAADIVLVSTDTNNLNPYTFPSKVIDGIDVIFNYSSSVNKPSVINMSLGSHIGPHNGTSVFDQFCDNIIGPGKILVGAAGNEGATPLHLSYSFNTVDTLFWTCIGYESGPSEGTTIIDIWGEPNRNFGIGLFLADSANPSVGVPFGYFFTSQDTIIQNHIMIGSDGDTCIIQLATELSNANNGQTHVQLFIQNSSLDEVFLTGTHVSNGGNIDIWNHGVGSGAALKSLGYPWALDGDTDITIGEIGGTGNEIISVGAYCSKNSWTSLSGMPSTPTQVLDDVASFSSLGPTVDGRVKPDISAPGAYIASSVNSFHNNYSLTDDRVVGEINFPTNNSQWLYAVMAGTSMASPMVTGIIALLLEVNPNLTPNQIKSILNNNAIVDNYTGTVPNNTWGYGKINAYTSILDILTTISWDCNGQGNCYDPGTGNGQYSSLSQCQSNCVAISWDCNSQGNCYDPGTGNGQYSSLSQCQSNCINVSIEEIGLTEFNIFPNPSHDLFNISFVSNRKQDLRLRVLNLVGEEIVLENSQQFVGDYTKQINLEGNAKGIYFFEIETDGGIINKKLILQ